MGVCLSKKSHNGKLTDIFRSDSRDSSTTTYFESATTFMREFSSFDGGHCRLHARLPRVVKMVVLGCENTGKSTIIRQLRLIHGQKFTEKELKAFKKTIQDNTWSSYKTIVNLIDFEGGEENNRDSDLESVSTLNSLESDFRLKTAKNEKHEIIVPENIISLLNLVKIVQEVSDLMLTSELVSSLQNLKGIFDKLNLKITISDREKYLISNTPRILNTNYTPSDTDILNCKSVTTGPTEYIIENCCQKWTNSQKIFSLKWQFWTVLSKNNSHLKICSFLQQLFSSHLEINYMIHQPTTHCLNNWSLTPNCKGDCQIKPNLIY